MPISDSIPDGSLVKEIAALVLQKPDLKPTPRGEYVIITGDKVEHFGVQFLATPETLEVSTLTAIVDAYKNHAALLTVKGAPLVHVTGPKGVRLVETSIGDERQEFVYMKSEASVPSVAYDRYEDLDSFILKVHTHFAPGDDRTRLLSFVGNLTAGVVSEMVDDGASQSVTSKRGVTRAGGPAAWQNPVFLTPYRTFAEIEQPQSPFVFRMKEATTKDNSGNEVKTVACALFEADGGAWKTAAITGIAQFLRTQLPEAIILA